MLRARLITEFDHHLVVVCDGDHGKFMFRVGKGDTRVFKGSGTIYVGPGTPKESVCAIRFSASSQDDEKAAQQGTLVCISDELRFAIKDALRSLPQGVKIINLPVSSK